MSSQDRKFCLALSRAAPGTKHLRAIWALLLFTVSFGSESISQVGQDRAREAQAYQDYVTLMACIVAQNGLRAYLEVRARVSFDSCASKKFEVDISTDDRDYTVSGYATVLPPSGPSVVRHFSVHIDHAPGAYPEWNFKVGKIEIAP
jgi:hypothetical protein